MKKEDIGEKDMTPILIEDLGMEYPNENSKQKRHYGIFQCQYCGKEFRTQISSIKSRNTKSCGCINGTQVIHGFRSNKFYHTWNNMKQRCYNEKTPNYNDYGGRGIKVCDEWLHIENFIEWAEETYIEGMSLDRINVNGDYEPSNCRWTNATVQSSNRRKQCNNTSGYVGIYKYKNWVAYVKVNNKSKYLGSFKNLEDAVKARDDYILKNNLPNKLSAEY